MMRSKNTLRASSLVAALALGSVLLAGCTGEGKPTQPSTSAPAAEAPNVQTNPQNETTPTTDPSAAADQLDIAPPEALAVPAGIQDVAVKFITERENQISHYRAQPRDWFESIRPLMTAEGFAKISDPGPNGSAGADGGYVWETAHAQGLAVRADVRQCYELTQAGGSDTSKVVSCAVTDIVVGKDGKNVPTNAIPSMWPYIGEQRPALLEMKKEGEGWKVNSDMTGLAN